MPGVVVVGEGVDPISLARLISLPATREAPITTVICSVERTAAVDRELFLATCRLMLRNPESKNHHLELILSLRPQH